MATGLGYLNIFTAGKETTWGTAVAVTDKIPIINAPIIDEIQQNLSPALVGDAGHNLMDQTGLIVQGSIEAELCYDKKKSAVTEYLGTDLLVAAAMGSASNSGASNYRNYITLADDLATFLTLAFSKRAEDAGVNEVASAMINKMTIKGVSGEPLSISVELIAHDLIRTGQTNDWDDNVSSIASGEIKKRIMFPNATLMLATDFADELAAADEVRMSEFTLTLDNKLSAAEFASVGTGGNDDAERIIQPVRDGKRECTLQVVLPRHTADTYFGSNYLSGTAFQAEIQCGRGSDLFNIYMPFAQIIKPEAPLSGAEHLTETIDFQLLRGAAYNAGTGNTVMFLDAGEAVPATNITEEFAIQTKNGRQASILA